MSSRVRAAAALTFTVIFCSLAAGCGSRSGRAVVPTGPYSLAQSTRAAGLTYLYAFPSLNEGEDPTAPVVFGRNGNIYGTTHQSSEQGLVYFLKPNGHGYTESVLYQFKGCLRQPVGCAPGPLATDGLGHFFCVTLASGVGTLVELTPGSDGKWTAKALYSLPTTHENYNWILNVNNGDIYTAAGDENGVGYIYKFTPSGSGFAKQAIYTQSNWYPNPGMIITSSGSIFGAGSSQTSGELFKLTPNGTTYQKTVLVTFSNPPNNGSPAAQPIMDAKGNLFGTTIGGGAGGCGAVYEASPSGSAYTAKVIDSVNCKRYDLPSGAPTLTASGTIYYGTEYAVVNGSDEELSTVFSLTPSGSGYTKAVVHQFTGGSDGWGLGESFYLDPSGTPYSSTGAGGGGSGCADGCGTLFKI